MPRAKAFVPDRALEEAMLLFWEKGFTGTSVQDLVERLGINRFSLYSTFGGKRDLFLAALDRYGEAVISGGAVALERAEDGLEAIRRHFRGLTETYGTDPQCRGCFLVNAAVELAPRDREARARLAERLGCKERAFRRALAAAGRRGELHSELTLEELARFLTGAELGLGVLARVAVSREVLEAYVRGVLAALDGDESGAEERAT